MRKPPFSQPLKKMQPAAAKNAALRHAAGANHIKAIFQPSTSILGLGEEKSMQLDITQWVLLCQLSDTPHTGKHCGVSLDHLIWSEYSHRDNQSFISLWLVAVIHASAPKWSLLLVLRAVNMTFKNNGIFFRALPFNTVLLPALTSAKWFCALLAHLCGHHREPHSDQTPPLFLEYEESFHFRNDTFKSILSASQLKGQ